MLAPMTPQAFVAKWNASTRNELAAAQEHFLDLCDLLNEPKPGGDPTGSTYAFEMGATKATQGEGWADVWRCGRFAQECKSKGGDLDAAFTEADGWSADIGEDVAMDGLLALNLASGSASASN